MKSKQPASNKKQSIVVKDLTAKKNPKGGFYVIKMKEWIGTETKIK